MDPDQALQELRELYNEWQDNDLDSADYDRFVQAFDALDNWIVSGGFLPKEWT